MVKEYRVIRFVMKSMIVVTLFLAVFALVRGSAVAAEYGVPSHVPPTISQISDPTLQMALSMYSPNYDSLGHSSKVAAYVNIYKSLYGGATPPLTGGDTQMLSTVQAAQAAQSYGYHESNINPDGTHRYEPWHDPDWRPWRDGMGILSRWYDD